MTCKDTEDLVLTLFNPFTRRTIPLPAAVKEERVDGWSWAFQIKKVVLSADPCLFSNDFEAWILHREVVHFKAGNNTWTHIDTRTMTLLMDVIDHKGQFLAVTENGELISISVNSGPATSICTEATRQFSFCCDYSICN